MNNTTAQNISSLQKVQFIFLLVMSLLIIYFLVSLVVSFGLQSTRHWIQNGERFIDIVDRYTRLFIG